VPRAPWVWLPAGAAAPGAGVIRASRVILAFPSGDGDAYLVKL
jgi:hypothetical protein